MKALLYIGIALTAFTFSSCDKMKEERFSTTIPYVFEFDIQEDDTTYVDVNGTITSMINSELEKVKDDIKRYELVSMEYKTWEFWGDSPNLFNGTIGVGDANSSSPGVSYSLTDIDLQQDGVTVPINFGAADVASIQKYFMDTNGLRLFLSGNTSDKPVHFKLQVIVNIDAIAEVEKKK